jgi:serpin B
MPRPLVVACTLIALAAPLLARGAPPAAPDLASSSNQLGFDLHRALRGEPGNFAFSPASIFVALVMPWSGARGATAAETARVMHVTGGAEAAVPAAAALLGRLNDPARTAYTLRVANRLFADKSLPIERAWLDRMTALGAAAEPVDFRRAPEAVRGRVNAWVAQETADRIKDLLPPGSVNAETRLALVNAVYLLAEWAQPFTAEATQPRPFYAGGTAARPVPTMRQLGTFAYAEAPGLQVLEMPYKGGELAMTIVLPSERTGLGALEGRLDAAQLAALTASLKKTRVSVLLPKFKVDPARPLALAEELTKLGMALAFDPRRADFTGIAPFRDPADRLYISQVFHKAFVKVDEKGTEAAAATAAIMARAGSAVQMEPPKEFVADHPFLFVIRDVRSGLILFLGRVVDPA